MKFMELSLRRDPDLQHPMVRFLQEHPDAHRSQLLYTNLSDPDVGQFLFYVEAAREPYESRLRGVESVREYDLSPVTEDAFYLHVTQELGPADRRFMAAFEDTSLVVVPPTVYDSDGTTRMTVVGHPEDLSAVVDALGADHRIDVERVGEYDRPHPTVPARLTDRQREAVRAAVDVGYYAVPREGDLAAVAERLGCAASTASNHLRKAEARVMTALVEGS